MQPKEMKITYLSDSLTIGFPVGGETPEQYVRQILRDWPRPRALNANRA